jgi:soluble lytic murein transglycosylase
MWHGIRIALGALVLVVGCGGSGDAASIDPAAVRRVAAAAERRDWDAATATAAATGQPALETWVRWRRLRSGEVRELGAYRAFLDRHPGWPELARIQVAAEELLDGSQSPETVRALFAGRQPRSRPGRLHLAAALLAEDRLEEGRSLLRQSWVADDHPAADERWILDRFARLLRPEDHGQRLERLLWDGSTAAARRLLPLVEPRRRAVAEARIALQAGGKTADRAIRRMPAEIAAEPGVLFDRIRLERRRGRHAAARALLLGLEREPVRPDAWWAERSHQVRAALDGGDARLAYRLAAGHRLSAGPAYAEAEWLAGWIALQSLQRPHDALRHFERLFERVSTPLSGSRAAYWAGRAATAARRPEAARTWLERASRWSTTFYGQAAASEIGRRPRLADAPADPDPAARRAFARDELVVLAEAFCAAGLAGEAGPAIRRLAEDAEPDPARLGLVLELAARCGRLDLATALARAPVRDGRADPLLAFPVPRVDGFLAPSAAPTEPALLLAVARQESQFDPTAVSPAGARGLMQLMPATARAVARELALGYDPGALLAEPAYNLRLGAHYLGRQLERFAEPALALAAYNAGPGRVEAWLSQHGDPRGDGPHALIDWIERIPFRETRNYVQRVLEAAEVYRLLLAERAPPARPLASPVSAAALDRGEPALGRRS